MSLLAPSCIRSNKRLDFTEPLGTNPLHSRQIIDTTVRAVSFALLHYPLSQNGSDSWNLRPFHPTGRIQVNPVVQLVDRLTSQFDRISTPMAGLATIRYQRSDGDQAHSS